METAKIIYFNVNNWFGGRDYPPDEQMEKWIADRQFANDEWCKKNKLCVLCGPIDMSMNYCITATEEWVKENYPILLTDETYTYHTIVYHDGINERREHTGKYSDFLRYPDEFGEVYGRYGWKFREYSEENFGVSWTDEDW